VSDTDEDPCCPECGEPIGQTATYCMHCSADLTEERAAADADDDGVWDGAEATTGEATDGTAMPSATSDESGETIAETATATMDTVGINAGAAGGETEQLLAPDGLLDNTLTVLVGIVGGIVVGVIGTVVLLVVTGSGWAVLLGLFAWLGATAYLVRRPTVQEAVAKSGYATAAVLLAVPVIALSPVVGVDGGLQERGGLFVVLAFFVGLPAGIAAAFGWVASRFVSDEGSGSEN
jgi:hypothetical protein